VKPIDRLTGGVQALQRGDYDRAHMGVHSNDEVG
jgi:hypothetical protein